LQLHTLLKEPITFRKVRKGVWHFQNRISRYTVLASVSDRPVNHNVIVQKGSKPSIVEMVVIAPMRLRFLVEDVDTFHQGASHEENYFGSLAAEDFFHPVQIMTSKGEQSVLRNG